MCHIIVHVLSKLKRLSGIGLYTLALQQVICHETCRYGSDLLAVFLLTETFRCKYSNGTCADLGSELKANCNTYRCEKRNTSIGFFVEKHGKF